jgi:hypothetical protein
MHRLPDVRQPLPAEGALDAALPRGRAVRPLAYGAAVVALFVGIVAAAMLSGHWRSGVELADYLRIVPALDSARHP